MDAANIRTMPVPVSGKDKTITYTEIARGRRKEEIFLPIFGVFVLFCYGLHLFHSVPPPLV